MPEDASVEIYPKFFNILHNYTLFSTESHLIKILMHNFQGPHYTLILMEANFLTQKVQGYVIKTNVI